jgi:hypothetical protein
MMTMKSLKRFGAAGVAALLACSSIAAQAATDGTFGATSQGTVGISASVPSRVQISKLTDVAFTLQDPASAASNAQNVCVFSNTATKGYNIKATGSGASSAFTLGATGGLTVPYTVEWAQTTGQTSGTALTTNVALTGQTSAAIVPGCTSGAATTASLIVKMSTTALESMQSSTSYTGTLTLLVGPE